MEKFMEIKATLMDEFVIFLRTELGHVFEGLWGFFLKGLGRCGGCFGAKRGCN
jgi:hypothetical protein